MAETQNYSNHVRWFPLVHFVIQPLLVINLLCHLVRLVMAPSWERGFWALLSVVLILMVIAARLQALQVQNRLIRLEEKLRYLQLLSPELAAKAEGLSVGQIIALRFASDAELPEMVERTLRGEFARGKDIKLAIKNWRGDYLRA
jgi:hypothetical protein